MTDRKAGAPGQYLAEISAEDLEKLQNGEQFLIVLTRDDHPVVEGTPYSKAAVLPDGIAALLCPDITDPTPADAFAALLPRNGGSPMTGALDMAKFRVINLGDPQADGDAISKLYAAQNFRPVTWTPTAEDIGARPNTWKPTPDEIGAAEKSTSETVTVTADLWTGDAAPYTATATSALATANNHLIVGAGGAVTAEQQKAMAAAMIICTGQTDGSITLTAFGNVPTIDLPVNIICVG